MFGRKAYLPVDIEYESNDGEEILEECHASAENKHETVSALTSKYRSMLQDAKENIKLSQNKQKEQYDRKHSTRQLKFSVGTLVLKKDFLKKKRKGGCMDPKWLGPYKIIKDLGKGFFSLQCIDTEDVVKSVHGAHLKIYLNPPEIEKQHQIQHHSLLIGNEVKSDELLCSASSTEVKITSDEEFCGSESSDPPLPPSVMPDVASEEDTNASAFPDSKKAKLQDKESTALHDPSGSVAMDLMHGVTFSPRTNNLKNVTTTGPETRDATTLETTCINSKTDIATTPVVAK
uniref:Uncharacterized protein n=1 Tax=Amphimedon queenslandica TaxID=400682 RepID=A0A1X7V8J8_AMPQE